MAISPSSSAMTLFYPLDESGYLTTRKNLGYLGSGQDLSPQQSAGTDGIDTIPDGNGGKMAWLFYTRTGWTTAVRRVSQTTPSADRTSHAAIPVLPLTDADDDFCFGARFRWTAPYSSGGAIQVEQIFGLSPTTYPGNGCFALSILADSSSAPTAGRLRLEIGSDNFNTVYDDGSHDATGSPTSTYILPNYTYRVIVRVYNYAPSEWRYKVYVYEEDTGNVYTFTRTVSRTHDYLISMAGEPHAVHVGEVNTGTGILSCHYVDQCWLYDAPVTDDDALRTLYSGISVPWEEPDYNIDPADVRLSACAEGGTFPPARDIGVGVIKSRVPVGIRCQRIRLLYEGERPGRPASIRTTDVEFNSSGPRRGRAGNRFTFPGATEGFMRQLGQQSPKAIVDGRNISLAGSSARTRRGYRTVRDTNAGAASPAMNFFTFRTLSDGLIRLYKVNDEIYYDTGAGVVSVDAGHTSTQFASFGELGGRCFILTPGRQSLYDGNPAGVHELGEDGPTALTTAASAGGTLAGTFWYLVSYYDPTSGDETAPTVAAGTVSPATQKVTLTITTSSPASRFSQMRVYRSADGQGPTTATLVVTTAIAGSYIDTGLVDGTILVEQVNGTYITGTPPSTFGAAVIHKQRCFYYLDQNNPDRLYWTEAGTLARFFGNAYIRAEAPIRCVVSHGSRLIIFTDRSVEIVESDFIRDDLGSYSLQRTVISRTVGALNHMCAVNAHGRVFWADGRGAWTLDGEQPVKISERIQGLWKFVNTNLRNEMYVTYNHVEGQVWFGLAIAGDIQASSDIKQTVLVFQINKGIWCPPYEIGITFADSYDDDLNGIRYGGMTRAGTFVEMESYDGDGVAGDEEFTFEGDISTVVGFVVTPSVAPTGWTTNSLRGFGIVLRNPTTGVRFHSVVESNTSTTFTIMDEPSVDFDGQEFYVGGIRWWYEPAEQDADTKNDKVLLYVETELDSLDGGRVF